MFARIGRLRFHPGYDEEVVRIARESLPLVRGLRGFHRITYLYDPASGWGFAISLWNTAQDAEAANERMASIADQFAVYGAGPLDDDEVHSLIGSLPTLEVIAEA